jgi:hypothetical protein
VYFGPGLITVQFSFILYETGIPFSWDTVLRQFLEQVMIFSVLVACVIVFHKIRMSAYFFMVPKSTDIIVLSVYLMKQLHHYRTTQC